MNDVGERIFNLLQSCGMGNDDIDFGKYHGFDGMENLLVEIYWILEEIFGDDEE